jgi:hypothetical protein
MELKANIVMNCEMFAWLPQIGPVSACDSITVVASTKLLTLKVLA